MATYQDANELLKTATGIEKDTDRENSFYADRLGAIDAGIKPGAYSKARKVDVVCQSCGTIIRNTDPQKKYCDNKCRYSDKKLLRDNNEFAARKARVIELHMKGYDPCRIANTIGYNSPADVRRLLSRWKLIKPTDN